jgi:hypothetical protein
MYVRKNFDPERRITPSLSTTDTEKSNRGLWFLLAVPFLYFVIGTSSNASEVKPKVLLFSPIDVGYLNETLIMRGNDFGFRGVMLAYIGEWWSKPDELLKHERSLKRLTTIGASCGLDSNFIKVALGYRTIPEWDDDSGWDRVTRTIGMIASLARRTGIRGLAIDTENYDTKLWWASSIRFKAAQRESWRGLVRERGTQVMRKILSAYPEAEIVLLQEGGFWWHERQDKFYELWIDFFNGLASLRPKQGIVLGTESTYSIINANAMGARALEIEQSMLRNVQDPDYWRAHGSVAIGMWPIGKTYEDKSARYSLHDFKQQFSEAVKHSSRYVWIYGHGSAWYQMSSEDIERYNGESHSLWGLPYLQIPTIPDLDLYRKIFASNAVSVCIEH